jgi:hypothetical protein
VRKVAWDIEEWVRMMENYGSEPEPESDSETDQKQPAGNSRPTLWPATNRPWTVFKSVSGELVALPIRNIVSVSTIPGSAWLRITTIYGAEYQAWFDSEESAMQALAALMTAE